MKKPAGRRGKSERRALKPMNGNAAGIDIGATFHVVAVPPDRAEDPVRTFRSFTGDLKDRKSTRLNSSHG